MFETSVSHVSHGEFVLQRESQESMPRETVARQREREEREGSVISVAESMSKRSRRNSTGSHSLQTHREFFSDERDLQEHLERRAQQAVLVKKFSSEKNFLTEYDLEIQNSLEANQWAEQAQRERIHLCSELEMMNRPHQECYARSCQEMEKLKRPCYKEENEVTQQKMHEYSVQHGQESRTVSLLRDQVRKLRERLEFIEDSKIYQDPDSPSSFGSAHVSHQAFIPSSSKKTWPRIESAAKYTRGRKYPWKRF